MTLSCFVSKVRGPAQRKHTSGTHVSEQVPFETSKHSCSSFVAHFSTELLSRPRAEWLARTTVEQRKASALGIPGHIKARHQSLENVGN